MASRSVFHYELLEPIGAGGMGEVFKAQDKRLHRFVAIKVLARGKSGDPERRKRFIQEAQSASALSHPNIITIHDIFDEDDTSFIVMEYVSGRTLLDLIPPMGLRVGQVLQYSTQMADALSVAHAAGIIHRDFKPANVMVTGSGLVKILDFGLAKLTDPSSMLNMTAAAGAATNGVPRGLQDQVTLTNVPLTMEGSILGTVNYMSPEQAEGRRVDARSDIFSFGAVLYEMVTGRRAFQGDSDISTLSSVLRDEVRPIAELAPDVPHELEDIIRGCLRKDPNARWQSMKEVEMGLSGLKRRSDAGVLHARPVAPVSTAPVSTPPAPAAPAPAAAVKVSVPKVQAVASSPSKKISNKILIAGAAAVALLLAVGAGWWWIAHRRTVAAQVAQQVAAPVVSPQPESVPPAVVPPAAAPTASEPQASTPSEPSVGKRPLPAASTPAPAPAPVPPLVPREIPPAATKAPVQPVLPPVVSQPPPPKVEPQHVPADVVAVTVKDGLPFRIALAEDVPATAQGGQALTFRVLEDVKVGDKLVIPRGAAVTGSIASEGTKKRFMGIGGKMTFQLNSTESVDGQKLRVRAAAGGKADGQISRPIDTGKYAKSKDLAAARGTDYVAYVDGEQTVSVHK